ncbi:glycosyltransferase family 4 protein [Candidatus Woesearchaeota archaeon]|nr:glycosyltransferase family 4 protein [Candidatus Woesearchaeota archaeon]HIH25556.1 glycosyltransferase family 4 protein [Nanoarchaeota archaeon]
MKILIVSYYPLGFGGAEVSMKILASGLKKLGHEIIFASTGHYEGYKNYKLRNYRKIPFFFLRDNLLGNELIKIINKERIDIIHSNGYYTSLAVLKAAKKTGIKSVVHFRDYALACVKSTCLDSSNKEHERDTYRHIFVEYFPLRWIWEFYKWSYIKRSWKKIKQFDLVISNSNPVKEKLKSLGIESTYLANPVDLEERTKTSVKELRKEYKIKEFTILYAGTLEEHKGIYELLVTLKDFLIKNKVRFIIAGKGSSYFKILKYILENTIINAKMIGMKQHEEIMRLYKLSDLIVVPSIWKEPLPRTILEAMQNNKPVLATNVGGNIDLIKDEYNGYLIKNNEWEQRIKELMKNKSLREKLGRNGRKLLEEKHDLKKISKELEGMYKKILIKN